MPSVDYKLITQRLADTRSSGRVNPVLISTNAAKQIRPAILNTNIAAQSFTPLPTPQIVVDTTADAISKVASTWVDAAWQYQEREAKAKADDSTLRTEVALKQMLSEYSMLNSRDAVDQYDSLLAKIDATVQGEAGKLESRVKAKYLPDAFAMKKAAQNNAAQHKVKQFQQWQQELVAAKEVSARQALVEQANDSKAFMATIGSHMQAIEDMTGVSAEAKIVAQAEFFNNTLSDVISTNIANGRAMADTGGDPEAYFSKALEYIEIGLTSPFKGDGLMLAKQSAVLGQALSEVNGTRRQQAADERARIKAAQEQEYVDALNIAIQQEDRSILDNIFDPDDRDKAKQVFDREMAGAPSDPNALLGMYQQTNTFVENPKALFDVPGVIAKDKIEFLKFVNPAIKAGRSDLLKEAKEFADLYVPPVDAIMGRWESQQHAQTHNKIYQLLMREVNRAIANNTSPDVALEQAKQTIFSDPRYQENWTYLKINREALGAGVYGVNNPSLLKLADSRDYVPTTTDIQQALADDVQKVRAKHGLELFTEAEELEYLMANPHLIKAYLEDMTDLTVQVNFVTNKAFHSQATAPATLIRK